MGDLSPNLSRHEMACRCGCGFDTVDVELVDVIQGTVDHFEDVYHTQVILVITGPNRCIMHNLEVTRDPNSRSQHTKARAMDFKLFMIVDGKKTQIHPDEVAIYLEEWYPDKYGIGRYSNRTHLDTRTNGPARWDVR
jgi:uncharacterized protein YcbK (DUF882 family)